MECFICNFLGIVIALIVVFITFYKWRFGYWKRKGVPYIEPKIPFGNVPNPFNAKRPFTMDMCDFYKTMKKNGKKFAGFYFMNDYMFFPIDPELVKCIMAKDFGHFVNHGIYYNEKVDPLSAHLFAIEDEKWKNLRAKLSPTFTSGKMKYMFETILNCAEPFKEELEKLFETKLELDIKDLVARFTTDIIGSCAFGLECNSFKSPDAEFRKCGKLALEDIFKPIGIFASMFPEFSKKIGVKITSEKVSTFFLNVVKDTIQHRASNNIKRNDFMQLLIDMKNDGNTISINEIAAQAFVFFLAGFETSSNALSYCLYELTQNPEIQEKVREDVQKVLNKYDGKLTYDGIQEMKYAEQALSETLRMYPPLPILNRVCNKDYPVPNSDVIIEKGTKIAICVYGLQHDEEYFPDPEKFDPDRFSEKNKGNLVPYTYMPFGEGPRICIGMRFGMLQAKVALATILKDYKLKLSPKTPTPLTFNPKSFSLASAETIYLESEKIKKIN